MVAPPPLPSSSSSSSLSSPSEGRPFSAALCSSPSFFFFACFLPPPLLVASSRFFSSSFFSSSSGTSSPFSRKLSILAFFASSLAISALSPLRNAAFIAALNAFSASSSILCFSRSNITFSALVYRCTLVSPLIRSIRSSRFRSRSLASSAALSPRSYAFSAALSLALCLRPSPSPPASCSRYCASMTLSRSWPASFRIRRCSASISFARCSRTKTSWRGGTESVMCSMREKTTGSPTSSLDFVTRDSLMRRRRLGASVGLVNRRNGGDRTG
mmetsp:Transcript_9107/g.27291  ORF Transcript_9107/g.27291 Transcript_9107/m.27291 type:complete len:272 (+) Transcript_9107:510-1325(+)